MLSALVDGTLVGAAAMAVEVAGMGRDDHDVGIEACAVYARTRVQQRNGVLSPAEADRQFGRALRLARRAADQDATWQPLADALRDMSTAPDAQVRATADTRAWSVCAPWFGT